MFLLNITECREVRKDGDYLVKATLTADNPKEITMLSVLYDELSKDLDVDNFVEFTFKCGKLVISEVLFTKICLGAVVLSSQESNRIVITVNEDLYKEDLLTIAKLYYKMEG